MTRHGRLPHPARWAAAAIVLIAALLALAPGAERAAAAPAAAVCAAADCPSAGAPQRLDFGPLAVASAAATRRAASRRAVLRVRLSGVPAGRRAAVIVTAPGGRRWRIGRSRTFHPRRLGRWTVTGRRIVGADVTRFPKHRTAVVRIRRGGRGTVRVAYAQAVANDTVVASGAAVRDFGRNGSGYVLKVTDPGQTIGVGTVIAAGVTDETPQGALVAVTAVRRDGATTIATGEQAPLSAIGPQARIAVRPQLELGRGTLARAAAGAPEGAVEKPYRCSGGVDASIKGQLGLSAGSEIGISWGGFWHPLTIKAIAVARLQQSSNLTLRVGGRARCELDVDLLRQPIRYSPITFAVGPVPVVITPKLNFHVIAEGSVSGAVETTVRQALDARVGLEWDGDRLKPITSLDKSFSFTPPRPQADAGIMGGIGPKLMFDVYELGGPYLTAEGVVRFDVSATEDPWWRLSGGFQAGAGLRFKVWRFAFDRNVPDLLSKDWTIAKAGGAAPPSVAETALPGATVGQPYSATLRAQRGTAPISWSVAKGALPAGLALNPSTGAISGTPTTAGGAAFTVTATDARKQAASRELSIAVTAPAPAIATDALPGATLAVPYRANLAASGSTAPYAWSIAGGALPAGLTLDARSGVLSGVPAKPGDASFTVALTGADGQRTARAYALSVTAARLSIPSAQQLDGPLVETPYSTRLVATGGVAPLRWSVTGGALPAGLALAADGALSGTPTAEGAASFTATVTDAAGTTASRDLMLVVAYPALTVEDQGLLSPMAGQPYSAQLRATGGGAPIRWALTAGSLPSGLTLSASGAISGTAAAEGPARFAITATDRWGQTAAREIALRVVPNALEVLTTALPGGRAGAAYSQALQVRGGRAPYTWTRTSGSLPAGLTLAADGTVSGTPSSAANATFAVQVRDADGVLARGSVRLAIAGNDPRPLRSVSCPTDTFCMAGDYGGGVVTFDGSGWGAREVVTGGRAINAVACATATDCLLTTEDGGAWVYAAGRWAATPAIPGVSSSDYEPVRSLSCVTATDCFAAGIAGGAAAVWRWNGSAWSAPDRAFGSSRQLNSISCASATLCIVSVSDQQTVSFWNGATWSTPSSPGISWVQYVACTVSRRCVVSGTFGQVAFLDGGSWTGGGTIGETGFPVVVGCSRTDEQCAYGATQTGGSLFTWGASRTTAAGAGSDMFAISCSSSRLCVAVGFGGRAQRWDGSTWIDEGVIAAG